MQQLSPESRAAQLFPDPIHGSWTDKEDFELRKRDAQIQRRAYLKGMKDIKQKIIMLNDYE